MKKLLLLTSLAFVFMEKITAQTTAADSVKRTITQFFDGMKSADTAKIRSTMTDEVIFQTIARSKSGALEVRTENVEDFLKFVVKDEKGAADERIEFKTIEIDGILASVWTPYRFFYKGNFAHCGANSFQLVKIEDNWRIQYIIDTRRKKGCE